MGTVSAILDGAGGVSKGTAGTVTLSGANTYTGGPNLIGGTLQVGNNAALSVNGLAMSNGTTLQSGAAALVLANGIAITGAGTVDTNGNTMTLSGLISGGALAKSGAGSLILTNANSYGGGTNLNVGTIQISNAAALGTGTLAMANSTTLQSGAAGLTVANSIGITGTGIVDTVGNTMTLSGVVSGGALTKSGTGALILTNANDYTGGTGLNAGSIEVRNNAALGTGALTIAGAVSDLVAGANNLVLANDIVMNGGGIDTKTNTLTLAGTLSGSAFFSKFGSGTLILSGANSIFRRYSSCPRLDPGRQQPRAGHVAIGDGEWHDAGGGCRLRDAREPNRHQRTRRRHDRHPGQCHDAQRRHFRQRRDGQERRGRADPYRQQHFTGNTTVNAGTLAVNGSIASSALTTVNAGGTLGGNGTVGNTTINGGTLSPGNSIGTLTVQGNLVLTAAASYMVEVSTRQRRPHQCHRHSDARRRHGECELCARQPMSRSSTRS